MKVLRVMAVRVIWIVILLICPFSVFSQNNESYNQKDLMEMSLEELMNIPLKVTSKSEENQREAPSIVTVVTSSDIARNHCRDLVDVLNMVPGITIAKDDDYLSFFSRGLFGFEGRTLVMVDGMQLSDLYFGSYALGNEFPVHMIRRIEVIRGPGSVIYGGTAELSVINIITADGKDLEGGNVALRYGQLPSTMGHMDASINFGKAYNKFEYSVLATYGKGQRSDGKATYLGRNGVYDHNEKSAGNENSTIVVKSKLGDNTKLNFVYNHYQHNQIQKFGVDAANPDPSRNIYTSVSEGIAARGTFYKFNTLGVDLSHKINLNENFYLLPAVNYHYSYPFEKKQARENVITQRFKPSIFGIYAKNKIELILGGEYFADKSKIERPSGAAPVDYLRKEITEAGKDEISISNFAIFTNFKYKLEFSSAKLNLNAGLRYDNNEIFGDKINPRAAVTFIYNKFHSKLLYSSAFRAPLVANNVFSRYGLNPDPALNSRSKTGVMPEKTQVYEFEVGYQLNDKMFVSANVFSQNVDDIIEFRYNYLNDDVYSDNGGKLGSKGVEGEWKYMSKRFKALMNVSFVEPQFYTHENQWAYGYLDPRGGDTYITPDNDNGTPTRLELLGVPKFKLYSTLSYAITEKVQFNVNGLYLSERWAYNGNATTKKVDSQFIISPGLNFTGILKNTEIGLSVHDILNKRMNVITGWYDGGYDVLPYKGREISISLRYSFHSSHLKPSEI